MVASNRKICNFAFTRSFGSIFILAISAAATGFFRRTKSRQFMRFN